jgi:hypothetical protein
MSAFDQFDGSGEESSPSVLKSDQPKPATIPNWIFVLVAVLLSGIAGFWWTKPPSADQDQTKNVPVALPPDIEYSDQSLRQPPAPIGDHRPRTPAGLRARMTKDLIIAVKAYVDVTGTVIGAVPLRQGDPLIDELGVFAAESVMKWHFEPARDRGVKVPGQAVVHVPFSAK